MYFIWRFEDSAAWGILYIFNKYYWVSKYNYIKNLKIQIKHLTFLVKMIYP